MERLENHQRSFSNLYVTSPTSQLILEPFRRFTYVTAYSPTFRCFTYVTAELIMQTFPSLHLRHNSFSVALPTSQLILQLLRHFSYVTTHFPTLPSLYLRHSSFFNLSVTSPKSQLILRRFTYVTAHSPTLPLLHLCHSSFSNPSFASPTSQTLHLIHLASRPWPICPI